MSLPISPHHAVPSAWDALPSRGRRPQGLHALPSRDIPARSQSERIGLSLHRRAPCRDVQGMVPGQPKATHRHVSYSHGWRISSLGQAALSPWCPRRGGLFILQPFSSGPSDPLLFLPCLCTRVLPPALHPRLRIALSPALHSSSLLSWPPLSGTRTFPPRLRDCSNKDYSAPSGWKCSRLPRTGAFISRPRGSAEG